MKLINSHELIHGDVYKEEIEGDIYICLSDSKRKMFHCATHMDMVWENLNPHKETEEVYLITTLQDIGEIIKESLKNES